MQTQVNKFEKITQEFGSASMSKAIANRGLTSGDVLEVDGNFDAIDINAPVRFARGVRASGQKYSDGLYDRYVIQDYTELYIEDQLEKNYIFQHDGNMNLFSQYVSNIPSIASKYVFKIRGGYILGKMFDRNKIPGDCNLILTVTNNVISNTLYQICTVSGHSWYARPLKSGNLPNEDNIICGQVALSDLYLETAYGIPSSLDDACHRFDLIFELEFKRIIA